jgi:hypothetical protein
VALIPFRRVKNSLEQLLAAIADALRVKPG